MHVPPEGSVWDPRLERAPQGEESKAHSSNDAIISGISGREQNAQSFPTRDRFQWATTLHNWSNHESSRAAPTARPAPETRLSSFFTKPAGDESAAVFAPPPVSGPAQHRSPADGRRA